MPWIAPGRRDPASRRLYRLYDRGEHRVTEAHLRAARRAYYAMIGHADRQLGRLRRALEITGQAERTAILVTADHGDVLGERGLWYKMTFFERAVRVPLILYDPGRLTPRRVGGPVSLVDVLPTLLDLAGQRTADADYSLDGVSLLPAARSDGPAPSAVYGEYMAEGTEQPMFMIRRGRWKYVTCPGDPPMLYDLATDPLETVDRAGTRDAAAAERRLAHEAERKWDAAGLREAIVESQRARRQVHAALMRGRLHPWDYESRRNPATQYFRNYGDPDPERPMRLSPTRRAPTSS